MAGSIALFPGSVKVALFVLKMDLEGCIEGCPFSPYREELESLSLRIYRSRGTHLQVCLGVDESSLEKVGFPCHSV